jgi:polyvinyl alcohol dehydrogenase (cytochrome)
MKLQMGLTNGFLRVMAVLFLLGGLAGTTGLLVATVGGGPDWGMIGNDSTNSRNQPLERSIGPDDVGNLAVKWIATTTGDVSATPAVVDGAVYFGDFGGTLWKLDAETGHVVWSHLVSDYTGIAGDIARTSPSVAGNTLVVGDLKHPYMLGIDTKTGDLRWMTQSIPASPLLAHRAPMPRSADRSSH